MSEEVKLVAEDLLRRLGLAIKRINELESSLSSEREAHEAAIRKAAVEICSVYTVSTPRGVKYANPPQVTIAIIIGQAIKASRMSEKEPKI